MKYVFIVFLVLFFGVRTEACDICGCSAQGSSLGLLPGVTSHFVGLRYHYRAFKSEHPAEFSPNQNDWSRDYFSTAELWGRIVLYKRLELFAFVPFNHYQVDHYAEGVYSHTSMNTGIGDASLMLNAVLLRTSDNNPVADMQHQWQIGGGVKAPTGKFGEVDPELGIVLPNMQAGTGSWDFSAMTNYRLQWKNWGMNVNASYRYNTPNALRYQFGQSMIGSVDFLRVIAAGNDRFQLIPQIGARFEYFDRDYSNQSKRERNDYSGGRFIYASAGFDGYVGNFGIQLRADLPVSQNFASGYVRNQWRFSAGMIYLFNSNKNN